MAATTTPPPGPPPPAPPPAAPARHATGPLVLRAAPDPSHVRPGWLAGLVAAAWSAATGLVLLGVVALVVWADDGATASVPGTLGSAVDVWLVAQGSGIRLGVEPVTLVPWGLAALPLLLLHRTGRWAAAAAGVRRLRTAVEPVVAGTLAYAGASGLLAHAVRREDVVVHPGRAALATTAVAVVGLSTGVLSGARLWPAVGRRLPRPVRDALAGGAAAAAAVLTGGALLVAAALVLGVTRVQELLTDVGAGFVGSVLLTVASAGLLPNAAVWAASVAAGPGFALGVGTSYGTGGTALGPVPGLPLLGGLPEALPTSLGAVLLVVPAVGGALAAWVLHRRRRAAGRTDLVRAALDALASAVVAGLLLGAAAWLSGGGLGDGRLSVVGSVPWQVAAAVTVETGLVVLPLTLALAGRDGWRARLSREPAVAGGPVEAEATRVERVEPVEAVEAVEAVEPEAVPPADPDAPVDAEASMDAKAPDPDLAADPEAAADPEDAVRSESSVYLAEEGRPGSGPADAGRDQHRGPIADG